MLSFVPTPIGNLEDLSFRALKTLERAEVFFCEDTRVTKKLLSLLVDRQDARFVPDALFLSLHSHNENERLSTIDPEVFKKPCVYVSDAGMPGISDPASALVRFCQAAQIPYEVLPGANAVLTALVASGFGDSRFFFEGFLPHKQEARKERLKTLLGYEVPVVLYEAPARILTLSKELATLQRDRPVAFFKELTKQHERHFVGSAAVIDTALQQANTKGEWAVVIGPSEGAKLDGWLIEALLQLDAPKKPLAKILSRLSGEPTAIWYDKLNNERNLST